jgi:predicted transcriptional regulator
MRRITISLPDELAYALGREARRRAMPASGIVRDALTAYLGIGGSDDQRELPFAALGRSGHADTAHEMEALLEQEWTAVACGR